MNTGDIAGAESSLTNTVCVLGARCIPVYDMPALKKYAECLPKEFKKTYYAYRNDKDRCLYLLGKLLILKGASLLGYNDVKLEQIQLNCYGKPFLLNGPDFNISHSGDYVICGFSRNYKIGLDVEQVQAISYSDYMHVFTTSERSQIFASPDPLGTFYRLWTQKEAAIKADGRGMQIPLQSVEVNGEEAMVCGQKWFLKELVIENGYMAHIALNKPLLGSLKVKFINVL